MSVARPVSHKAGPMPAMAGMSEPIQDLDLGRSALLAIEAGAIPFVVLSRLGEIVHASQAALVLLDAGRAFSARGNRLVIRRREENARFKQAMAQAPMARAPVMIQLHNRQGNVNHLLTIRAVPQSDLVLLLVAELRLRTQLAPGWSRKALDLPASLAELAEALTDGLTLAEFGDQNGLTFEGARTRLRKLLTRTGTKSQMELTALMHRAATVVFPSNI